MLLSEVNFSDFMTAVILKSGKEKIFHQKHHWIFSGAIKSFPDNFSEGQVFPIKSEKNELLGHGYFNSKASLSGRILSFGDIAYEKAISQNISNAIALRKTLFNETTTGFRLINGEGDLLPGLVVDQYGNYLVMQISTLGMEKLKPLILSILSSFFPSFVIYEKSLMSCRSDEGLPPFEGTLVGEIPEEVEFLENNIRFLVSFKKGQKTGFYLDQREMRSLIGSFSKGKKVLNCFCYTGGFSVYALKNKAFQVDSLDISQTALDFAKKNVHLNGFNNNFSFFCEDAFNFLKERDLNYDLIILDPPAFAKKKKDVTNALKGYKEINKETLKKMPKNSFLLTCSCSYHVDEELFQKIIFHSAQEAKRSVKIISKHCLSFDHTINIFHPEGNYLKSLFLFVE